MKIIMIKGITSTGKTTTAEAVIKELRKRGYTVGSVKDIHFEEFTMETEGTNTDRHKKAGAHPVTARGFKETDVMFDHTLDIDDILDFYNQDYVVLEGDSGANCPNIITGTTIQELDDQYNELTIAVSGVISANLQEYKGLPIINGMTDVKQLVDLIEEKTPDRMPNYSTDCCTACGTGCRGLTAKILRGTGSISECILKGQNVQLFINDEEVPMVPFVKQILRGVTEGMVAQLDGYEPGSEITIKIK